MTGATEFLALGLTGDQVIELIDEPALRARWDALPVAFTVLGLERLDPAIPTAATLEPTVAASTLAAATARARMLAPAGFGRDHPYNLARRSASAGHLSHGRIGLVFGDGPAEKVPAVSCAALVDGIDAVRALEQSWPYDAVVADRATGVFVQSDRIDRVNIDSTYSIAGPLTVPEPEHGASVLAWWAPRGCAAPIGVDVSIGPLERIVPVDRAAAAPDAGDGVDGRLLSALPGESLTALLDEADRLLRAGLAPAPEGPLRTALALPAPERLLDRSPAFAAPIRGARL